VTNLGGEFLDVLYQEDIKNDNKDNNDQLYENKCSNQDGGEQRLRGERQADGVPDSLYIEHDPDYGQGDNDCPATQ